MTPGWFELLSCGLQTTDPVATLVCWSGGHKAFDSRRRLRVCCAEANWDWLGKGIITLLASVSVQCNTTPERLPAHVGARVDFSVSGVLYVSESHKARVPSRLG